MRSPTVGPWRVACWGREYRSGTRGSPRPSVADEVHLVRLARRPPQGVARGQVEPESVGRLAVEREVLVRTPEREVGGHTDRMLAAVRHGQMDPLTSGGELDVAVGEPDRTGPVGPRGAERLPDHEEPCALLEQDLHADLLHDRGDVLHHLLGPDGVPAGREDLIERAPAAG